MNKKYLKIELSDAVLGVPVFLGLIWYAGYKGWINPDFGSDFLIYTILGAVASIFTTVVSYKYFTKRKGGR